MSPRFVVHPLASGRPPAWASAWGQNRFGPFAEFELQGVRQRMRWLPPGTFTMGSPETEQGRFDSEVQRDVSLAEPDVWIADTPCTQRLWEAVMGENPSRFKSPDRPVERVSFDDVVGKFLPKLNELVPGLDARLPTEEEWEYACRAGTKTAVYLGRDAISGHDTWSIKGQNNAEWLDPIAWYGGNSGVSYDSEGIAESADSSTWPEKQHPHTKAGTRRVKQKAPNPWGLYDTVGNVFEWCASMWSSAGATDYAAAVSPDMRVLRVLRGGSWNSVARYCRAAYRRGYSPGDRRGNLGFRLARGRTPSFK